MGIKTSRSRFYEMKYTLDTFQLSLEGKLLEFFGCMINPVRYRWLTSFAPLKTNSAAGGMKVLTVQVRVGK